MRLAVIVWILFMVIQTKVTVCKDKQSDSEEDDKYFIIRNSYSGLVLDASRAQIKLQHFTGASNQLWKAEPVPGGHGRFFIVNKKSGKVLDAPEHAKTSNIITSDKTGGINQQWYINSDGTRANGAKKDYSLDICREKYSAGTDIILYWKRSSTNQLFDLEYL